MPDTLTAPAAPPPPLPRAFRYTLPMQRGDDVRRLQELLRRADPEGAGREITVLDGLFGPATRRAVLAFQARAGMADVDGVVGPDTWAALWLAAAARDPAAAGRGALEAAIAESRRANGPAGVLARALPGLTRPHSVFSGGLRWALTPRGIELEGCPLPGAAGPTTAIRRALAWFGDAFRATARETEVPLELLLATACTEVLGDARRHATPEAAARALRLEPGYISDEATPRRVSPGLMQTLISTAQQMMPEVRVTRELLFQPIWSIRAGALYIRAQAPLTRLDPPVVACAYNAGAVHEQAGAANHWRMRQYPIGRPDHADRFVVFFNQCFREFAAEPSLAGEDVPSLFRALNP